MSLLKFKALADDTRLRLTRILFYYELSVNELVQILGMGQSRVSRHLKILAEAGLLRSRRDGLWVFYSVPAEGRGRDFLMAVLPFIHSGDSRDLDLAANMLEERATRARQFFNAIADNWDDLNSEILGDFNLSAKVLQAMPRNCGVAVDLGCGTGAVLLNILPRAQACIGVDGSARMLELCKNRMKAVDMATGKVSLRIGELSHLPLADSEADFACINLVLHHLPAPGEIFREIRRILAGGGVLFIADFMRHTDESMRSRYGDHWLGFDMEDVQKQLEQAGFRVCNAENAPVGRELELFLITARTAA